VRNVAVELGNWGALEAVPTLAAALNSAEPLVRGRAAWAAADRGTAGTMQALRGRAEVEEDPWVREEVEAALEP
jgi:HEAT repeat protein